MEQYASGQFYREYHERPDEWRVERITAPRRSCEHLLATRQYAPVEVADIAESRFYKAGEKHDTLPRIYCNAAGNWYGIYRYQTKVHSTPTKPTPIRAALAYNDVIRDQGLPERYLIDFGKLGMDDAEEQSA